MPIQALSPPSRHHRLVLQSEISTPGLDIWTLRSRQLCGTSLPYDPVRHKLGEHLRNNGSQLPSGSSLFDWAGESS